MSNILRAFGCIKPKEEGKHTEAYVFCTTGLENTGAYFENGKDYIGHPTFQEAVQEYKKNIEKGWQPMTVDELKQYGCQTDETINTSAPTNDEKDPMLSPATLERITGIAEKFSSDLKEKQPDFVDYMKKAVESTGMMDKLSAITPQNADIGMLQEFSAKLMETLDADKREQLLGFAQKVMGEIFGEVCGENSANKLINELFEAEKEDESDDSFSDEEEKEQKVYHLNDIPTTKHSHELSAEVQSIIDQMIGHPTIGDSTDPLIELVKDAKL